MSSLAHESTMNVTGINYASNNDERHFSPMPGIMFGERHGSNTVDTTVGTNNMLSLDLD